MATLHDITEVMVNLLNNASKYTEPGSRIDIALRGETGLGAFSVTDTGIGIPAAQLANSFEPFTQLDAPMERARGGLGLGLTLVRRLVQLHGGTIAAHSTGPGQSSAFVVRLPLYEGAPPKQEKDRSPAATPAVSRSILLVEDNSDVREMLGILLGSWGHRVEEVGDGLAGLNAMRRQLPEVALVDVGLPGMDGYEVARRARALPGGDKVHLIAVTGYGQPADRRRALEAGFNVHLVKPVNPQKLGQMIAKLPIV